MEYYLGSDILYRKTKCPVAKLSTPAVLSNIKDLRHSCTSELYQYFSDFF